jgi:hypothetical protein
VAGSASSHGGTSHPEYATVCYETATGKPLWVARYQGAGWGADSASSLAVSPDGTLVFVTGWSAGSSSYDYVTVAYDSSTGAQRWVSRSTFGDFSDSRAVAVSVSPDGTAVYVTGTSTLVYESPDYATIRYDASTGAQQWVSRYNGPGAGTDSGAAMGLSPDGTVVFVTGSSTSRTVHLHYATVAYDAADGAQRWVSRYHGPGGGDDTATSLGVSPDGSGVFVTGRSLGYTSFDYATVAYDAQSGSQRWVSRYDGPGNRDDGAASLAVDPDGTGVFVSGSSNGGGNGMDYATVSYDATSGARRWVSRYDGSASRQDIARSLAASPDGSVVYVTGSSTGSEKRPDYATVAYDVATGDVRWVSLYDGPRHLDDVASSIAVSSGFVLVAGTSGGFAHLGDFLTVAYTT